MLTADDLLQLRMLIREELDDRLNEKLEPIKQELHTMKQELSTVKQELHTMKQELSIVKQELHTMKQEVSKMAKDIILLKKNDKLMKKDMGIMLNHLDRTDMRLYKRVDRIEEHLGLA